MKKILVTGGSGFIGSHFVIKQINRGNLVVNLDNLTYAANQNNLLSISNNKNYVFVKGDINDFNLSYNLLEKYKVDWVVNFAAESHVDNSISGPEVFIKTNINGTFSLLQAALKYYNNLDIEKKHKFRFLHISTDEVFGSLNEIEPKFCEKSQYKPNSPYSASKASSDHLVRAWHETYNLPTIITNCSNNFGPHQHHEKFIPTIIKNCLNGNKIPVYGDGKNIRDWIFVGDHCDGIELALKFGKIGECYLFGGDNEIKNIEIVNLVCDILDNKKPKKDGKSYKNQIDFVKDRLGHDFRYAICNDRVKKDLGFKISKNFEKRLTETIDYYLNTKIHL